MSPGALGLPFQMILFVDEKKTRLTENDSFIAFPDFCCPFGDFSPPLLETSAESPHTGYSLLASAVK